MESGFRLRFCKACESSRTKFSFAELLQAKPVWEGLLGSATSSGTQLVVIDQET